MHFAISPMPHLFVFSIVTYSKFWSVNLSLRSCKIIDPNEKSPSTAADKISTVLNYVKIFLILVNGEKFKS